MALQDELPKLRSALTRAKNVGKPEKIIQTVNQAFARFDVIGWPDCWSTWQIAKNAAEFKIEMRQW